MKAIVVRPGARLALLAIAALLASCAGGPSSSTAAPTSIAPSTAPATAPNTSTPIATASSTPTVGPTLTASPEPTASVSPSPSPSPSPSATVAFSCAYPYQRAADAYQVPLTVVRVGAHTGYDRVVWEFTGSGLPAVQISQVQPPFVHDGSGLPMTVAGSSFLQVRLESVATAYDGPQDLKPGYALVKEVAMQGHYEGVSSWIIGLSRATCIRVTVLSSPTRLVVDLQS